MVDDSILEVKRAKYGHPHNGRRMVQAWKHKVTRRKSVVQSKVRREWRVKGAVQEKLRGPVCYSTTEEEGIRLECMAVATLQEVYTLEVVQSFMYSSGLGVIKAKPLGAREVISEFQPAEEMQDILREGISFLHQMFLEVLPCSKMSSSSSHRMSVSIFNVPVMVWSYEFFVVALSSLGRIICQDDAMRDQRRFDVARVLLKLDKPWLGGKTFGSR